MVAGQVIEDLLKNKKQAISRILSCLIINLGDALLQRSIRLPSNLDALS